MGTRDKGWGQVTRDDGWGQQQETMDGASKAQGGTDWPAPATAHGDSPATFGDGSSTYGDRDKVTEPETAPGMSPPRRWPRGCPRTVPGDAGTHLGAVPLAGGRAGHLAHPLPKSRVLVGLGLVPRRGWQGTEGTG